jgi:hypothetical protein
MKYRDIITLSDTCCYSHPVASLNSQNFNPLFHSLSLTPQPPQSKQIANYNLADLTNLYEKYKRKRTNHILL